MAHPGFVKEEAGSLTRSSDLAASASGGNEQKRQALEATEEARKESHQPSFGSKLFFGSFDPQSLLPFPAQNADDRSVGDSVIEPLIRFLQENLDPNEVDVSRTIPQKVIDGMKEMGIFALKIPKEYGGLGLSQTNYCRLVLRVASYCGSVAVLISAHQSIGVPQPLKMFGTEAQKQKFLPRFRQGDISAFALTEPDVGSDPAQMTTEAVLSPDGSYYTLNGQKLWCTNGTIADIIIVMAKTAPKIVHGKEKKQITAFILEMNTPGIEVMHRCEFMGLGGIYNGLLKFTDVKIPAENVLWAEGRGLALALATINVGRLTLPAACTGAAKQCLSIARRWGASRVQWGQPIGLHESGREKIAFIASTTFAMEAMTWLTCAWADQQDIDIRIEAAMAKLFCSEAIWKIVDMTMQLRGGRGYEKARSLEARGEVPYPVERIMRDCRINMILEGSSEIMKLFLSREAIDPHLKKLGNILNPSASLLEKLKTGLELSGFYFKWYLQQLTGIYRRGDFKETGPLQKHFHFIKKHSHLLARTIFQGMVFYRQNLDRRQLFLGRLMDIGTELFAMAAVCSYALHLQKNSDSGDSPLELADYFCVLSERRIAAHFALIKHNDDRKTNTTAKKVLEKNYRWLEKDIVWMGPNQ